MWERKKSKWGQGKLPAFPLSKMPSSKYDGN